MCRIYPELVKVRYASRLGRGIGVLDTKSIINIRRMRIQSIISSTVYSLQCTSLHYTQRVKGTTSRYLLE